MAVSVQPQQAPPSANDKPNDRTNDTTTAQSNIKNKPSNCNNLISSVQTTDSNSSNNIISTDHGHSQQQHHNHHPHHHHHHHQHIDSGGTTPKSSTTGTTTTTTSITTATGNVFSKSNNIFTNISLGNCIQNLMSNKPIDNKIECCGGGGVIGVGVVGGNKNIIEQSGNKNEHCPNKCLQNLIREEALLIPVNPKGGGTVVGGGNSCAAGGGGSGTSPIQKGDDHQPTNSGRSSPARNVSPGPQHSSSSTSLNCGHGGNGCNNGGGDQLNITGRRMSRAASPQLVTASGACGGGDNSRLDSFCIPCLSCFYFFFY